MILRWTQNAVVPSVPALQQIAPLLGVPEADLIAAAYPAIQLESAHGIPTPPPLPREISRLIDAYTAITDPAERAEFLQRVDWVTEWATLRHRVRDNGPTKD